MPIFLADSPDVEPTSRAWWERFRASISMIAGGAGFLRVLLCLCNGLDNVWGQQLGYHHLYPCSQSCCLHQASWLSSKESDCGVEVGRERVRMREGWRATHMHRQIPTPNEQTITPSHQGSDDPISPPTRYCKASKTRQTTAPQGCSIESIEISRIASNAR